MLLKITVNDGAKTDEYCIVLPPKCEVTIDAPNSVQSEHYLFRDWALLPNQSDGRMMSKGTDSFGTRIDLKHDSSAKPNDVTGSDGK